MTKEEKLNRTTILLKLFIILLKIKEKFNKKKILTKKKSYDRIDV